MNKLIYSVLISLFFSSAIGQNIGVGTTTPTNFFHISPPSGAIDPVKIEGLRQENGETDVLIFDRTQGLIKYKPIATFPFNFNDVDSVIGNEYNTSFAINGTNLEITDGGGTLAIPLTSLGTDDQNLTGASITGSTLTIFIENGLSTSVDLQPIIDSAIANGKGDNDSVLGNEYNTNFIINGANLELTDGGGTFSVPLSSLGTDDQNIMGSNLTGVNLTIGIENGSSETINLQPIIDSAVANSINTDNQALSVTAGTATTSIIGISGNASIITLQAGTNVSLSEAGNTITIDAVGDGTGTDNQALSVAAGTATTSIIGISGNASSVTLQAGTNVTLSEAGSTITINATGDGTGTDDQNITGSNLTGVNLTIGIENGTGQTISLQPIIDSASKASWKTLGNAGTSASTNFLGTTDNNALTFRVNNEFAGTFGLGFNGNTYLGHQANFSQNGTGGSRNIGIGYQALLGPTTGSSNIAIGRFSMQNNAGGGSNIAIGESSMSNNGGGIRNIAIGINTLRNNGGGIDNIAIGESALFNSGIGGGGPSYNIAIGKNTMLNSGTGGGGPIRNVVIGVDAMQDLGIGGAGPIGTTGIGYAVTATNNPSNSTAIGNQADVNASNQIRIGNASVTSIGGYAAWSNLSDGRFKNNVQENVPGLSFITKLKPITYQLDIIKINQLLNIKDSLIDMESALAKSKETQTGFIAQDVEKAANELNFTFSGVDKPANKDGHYSLRYAEFVVPLVKAVQEQNELISKQQEEINKLKKENTSIQTDYKKQILEQEAKMKKLEEETNLRIKKLEKLLIEQK